MFRNAQAINEIGKQCIHLMWTLYLTPPNSPLGNRLMEAFPECFTDEPSAGPIPLSVLYKIAKDLDCEDLRRKCTEDTTDAMPDVPTLSRFWYIMKNSRMQSSFGRTHKPPRDIAVGEIYHDNHHAEWVIVKKEKTAEGDLYLLGVLANDVDLTL